MDNYSSKEFQKLVTNQSFIEWVKNPTPELNQHWDQFIADNPKLKPEIERAIYIIRRLQKEEEVYDAVVIQKLWLDIQSGINRPVGKKSTIYNWTVAASIAIIIGFSGLLFYQIHRQSESAIVSQPIDHIDRGGNEVKLILSDNSEKAINSKDPVIVYNIKGEILVDTISFSNDSPDKKGSHKEAINQLIVPKGQSSSLIFADGTKVFLNAGSRIIYPVHFNKKEREIYLEGEAYLDVAENAKWPFVVATKNMKVQVLGTEFNVKSYPDETISSVVLVKGSVQAIVESSKILLKENELFTLTNLSGETSVEKANVLEYISWKDGWLYCNNEAIENIAITLSRYYDVEIQFKDLKVKEMTMTGKLDLKSKCTQVLDVISFIAPVKYEEINGSIVISSK